MLVDSDSSSLSSSVTSLSNPSLSATNAAIGVDSDSSSVTSLRNLSFSVDNAARGVVSKDYSQPMSADKLSADNSSCVLVNSEAGQDIGYCAKDLDKDRYLKPIFYVLDNGLVFADKLLPDPSLKLTPNHLSFTPDYFVNLHLEVSLYGCYNHFGA